MTHALHFEQKISPFRVNAFAKLYFAYPLDGVHSQFEFGCLSESTTFVALKISYHIPCAEVWIFKKKISFLLADGKK